MPAYISVFKKDNNFDVINGYEYISSNEKFDFFERKPAEPTSTFFESISSPSHYSGPSTGSLFLETTRPSPCQTEVMNRNVSFSSNLKDVKRIQPNATSTTSSTYFAEEPRDRSIVPELLYEMMRESKNNMGQFASSHKKAQRIHDEHEMREFQKNMEQCASNRKEAQRTQPNATKPPSSSYFTDEARNQSNIPKFLYDMKEFQENVGQFAKEARNRVFPELKYQNPDTETKGLIQEIRELSMKSKEAMKPHSLSQPTKKSSSRVSQSQNSQKYERNRASFFDKPNDDIASFSTLQRFF